MEDDAHPLDAALQAVRDGRWQDLRREVWDWDVGHLGDLLAACDGPQAVLAFRAMPRNKSAEVFARLDAPRQEGLLQSFTDQETRHLLETLAPDDRTSLLGELPGEVTRRLMTLLRPEDLAEAKNLLGYPTQSVGRLMTPNYIALRPDWTLAKALEHVRATGRDSETMQMLYVTDEHGKLLDDVKLRQVILGDPGSRVWDIMNRSFASLSAFDDREVAVRELAKHAHYALPVVDSSGILLGIVTADDVLAVAEQEATEDIQKLGGQEALSTPYLQTSLWTMIRKRAGWLAVLFLGEMLTATAMQGYQAELQSALVLSVFIPLIISSGGNSGSQATTLIIRAMSLGEVRLRDWWRVARREMLTGVALGAFLAVIGMVRITVWHYAFKGLYGPDFGLVALAVGLSLIGVVTWGTISGSGLPFLLRALRFDPASASAPFVATLVDVSGLVIYFTIAGVVLGGHLL